MMERDRRLTGHIRGQRVSDSLNMAMSFIKLTVTLFRRIHQLQRISRLIVYGRLREHNRCENMHMKRVYAVAINDDDRTVP